MEQILSKRCVQRCVEQDSLNLQMSLAFTSKKEYKLKQNLQFRFRVMTDIYYDMEKQLRKLAKEIRLLVNLHRCRLKEEISQCFLRHYALIHFQSKEVILILKMKKVNIIMTRSMQGSTTTQRHGKRLYSIALLLVVSTHLSYIFICTGKCIIV